MDMSTTHTGTSQICRGCRDGVAGPSVFDLSVSGRPGVSEAVREGGETKTENRGPEGGPGPQGPSQA